MSKAFFASLALTTFLTPVVANAATVDQAGADRLRATFERYIGTAPSGQTPYVAVTPDGAAYKVTIDSHGLITAIAGAFKSPLNADAAPISFHAAPLDDGKWRIYDYSDMKASFAIKDQTGSITMEKIDFDGIYDPAIGAFTSSKMSVPLMTIDQQAPEMTATSTTRDLNQTTTGSAGHDGTTDIVADDKDGAYQQTITMTLPGGRSGAGNGPTTMNVKIGADSRAFQVAAKGMRTPQALDLWAMLLANATPEARAAHKEEFKAKVLEFLPIFDTFHFNDSFKGITLKTPYGQGAIGSTGMNLDISTAPSANSAAFQATIDDLSIDSVLIPPGVEPLLPTKMSFGAVVKNFDLTACVRKAIELEPGKDADPATKAAYDEALQTALVPSGAVAVTLPPSAISGKDYTIAWQGEVTAAVGKVPHATVHLDVKATGVDALARQVGQLKVPHAPEAMIGIYAAQALAKKQADGSVTWAIDFSDTGDLLVNGKPIGKK